MKQILMYINSTFDLGLLYKRDTNFFLACIHWSSFRWRLWWSDIYFKLCLLLWLNGCFLVYKKQYSVSPIIEAKHLFSWSSRVCLVDRWRLWWSDIYFKLCLLLWLNGCFLVY